MYSKLTGQRENAVDFTIPYYHDSSIIYSASPELISNALMILRPFSPEVSAFYIVSNVYILIHY